MRLWTALLVTAALAGCGAEATSVSRADLTCDQSVSSDDAKDTVERVGGVTGDGYTVAFAKSTRIGVIALVDGDARQAFDDLSRYPEIATVAVIEKGRDPGTISGFAQVDDLVAAVCN